MCEYAVDRINARGGLLGRQVKLLTYDTQSKPDVAVRQAKKAILEDGAKFISQTSTTAIASALRNIVKQYNVIHVNVHSEADYLMGADFIPNYFRTALNTTMHCAALAQYFLRKPYKKFFIVCPDYAFGHDAGESFKKVFKGLKPDAEIVGEIYHPMATKDFGPYITKILASRAEVVFTGNWGPDLYNLIKQSRSFGLKAVFASFYLDDPGAMNELRENALGCVTSDIYMSTIKSPENEEFLRTYREFVRENHPNEDPLFQIPGSNGMVVPSYYFLAEAIKKAGSVDAEKVIKAWEGLSMDGIVGRMTMRACDHQIQAPAYIGVVQKDHPFQDVMKFPFLGGATMIPAEKISVPPEKTGNPRCK
jgi:ABC-type branched-subunit amino acid transport system substrate-binding protein